MFLQYPSPCIRSLVDPINLRVYHMLQYAVNIPSGTESGSRSREVKQSDRSTTARRKIQIFFGNDRGADPSSTFAEFNRLPPIQRSLANFEDPSRKDLANCSLLRSALGAVSENASCRLRRLSVGPCLRAWTNGRDSAAPRHNTACELHDEYRVEVHEVRAVVHEKLACWSRLKRRRK
jgi:hypothetical protein